MTRTSPGFRWLVAATAFWAWMLVAVGGLVRVSKSGLSCPDWPLCNGRVVPEGQKEPIIEFSHLFTDATVVVLLVFAVVMTPVVAGEEAEEQVATPAPSPMAVPAP